MRIGIIGAGQIGGTLTRRLRALGHEVHVANSRDPKTLAGLAAETGAIAGWAAEMPDDADLVVVTIPMKSVPDLPDNLFHRASDDLVVIDTCNYYPKERDGLIAEIEAGMPESCWVERQLGHPVIKAFNNIIARHLLERGMPAGAKNRIALPVAGDDEKAKAVVMKLVDQLGFDAIDAGALDESWRQQPGTRVYTTDLDAQGVRRALSDASDKRPPAWTASSSRGASQPGAVPR
jgi:predicted dinucleotide-binding enzyme